MPPPLLAQATSYIQVHPFPKCDFLAFITSTSSLFNHLVPRLTAPTSSSLSVALRDHQLIQHETPLTNAKLCNLYKLCPTISFAQVLNLGHERNSAGGSLVLNYIDRLQVFIACQRSLFNCSFSSIAHKLVFLHTLVLEANTELSEQDFVAMGRYCTRLKHLNLQYSIGEYTDWVTEHVLSPSASSSSPSSSSSSAGGSWETIEEFMWTPIGTSASFKPKNLRKIFKYCRCLRILEITVPFDCAETRSLFEPFSSQETAYKQEEEEHFGHLVNLEQFCVQNLQFSNGMLNTIGSHLHRVKAVLAAGGNISDVGVFDLLQNRKISDCSTIPTYNFNYHHLLELDLSTQDDFMITSSYSRGKFLCRELEEFTISDSAVNAICENLIFLKRLILKGRKTITSDGLNNLKKLKFLEELNISGTAVSRMKGCLTDISSSIRELYMTDIIVPKTRHGSTDDEGEKKLNHLLQIDDLLEEFISRAGRCRGDVDEQHLGYIRFHEECLTEKTRGLVEKAQSLMPSFKYFYIDGCK